jgi:hypothetical protein
MMQLMGSRGAALLVAELRSRSFITDDLSLGPRKYMGVCVLVRRAVVWLLSLGG